MKKQTVAAKVKYDFGNDIFVARPIKREYDTSVKRDDFIFDLDKNNNIVGMEILNASKLFRTSKYFLKNHGKIYIELQVNEKAINIMIHIELFVRNSIRDNVINIERLKPDFINPSELNLAIA